MVPSNDDGLSDQLSDPSIGYSMPIADEKPTELGDVLTLDPTRDELDRTPERGPKRHPGSAHQHAYANPLAAMNPSPPPIPRSPTRSPVLARATAQHQRGGTMTMEEVSEEYAFGCRRGLSMRARGHQVRRMR